MASKQRYAQQYKRKQVAAERRWVEPIRTALNNQVNAFFDYAERNGLSNALRLIDTVVTEAPIANVLSKLYAKEGARAGRDEERYLNVEYGSEYKAFSFFTNWARTMRDFFYSIGLREVRRITDTTRKILREKVAYGAENQLSLPEIRNLLVQEDINKKRANVIARTETVTALNHGSHQAARSLPVKMNKEWIAIHDNRTRHSHKEIDGEVRPLDEKYSNGGQYPGDPELPGKERIQCRCTEIHVAVRDANGRLVLK